MPEQDRSSTDLPQYLQGILNRMSPEQRQMFELTAALKDEIDVEIVGKGCIARFHDAALHAKRIESYHKELKLPFPSKSTIKRIQEITPHFLISHALYEIDSLGYMVQNFGPLIEKYVAGFGMPVRGPAASGGGGIAFEPYVDGFLCTVKPKPPEVTEPPTQP